jgi:hypothetical protein
VFLNFRRHAVSACSLVLSIPGLRSIPCVEAIIGKYFDEVVFV